MGASKWHLSHPRRAGAAVPGERPDEPEPTPSAV